MKFDEKNEKNVPKLGICYHLATVIMTRQMSGL